MIQNDCHKTNISSALCIVRMIISIYFTSRPVILHLQKKEYKITHSDYHICSFLNIANNKWLYEIDACFPVRLTPPKASLYTVRTQ